MATSGGSSSGGGAVRVGRVTFSTGNISFTNVTAATFTELATLTGGPGTGGLDLSVQAASGDLLVVVPSFLANPIASICTDMQTVAGLRWVSTGTATGAAQGVAGWFAGTPQYDSVTGSMPYTVQATDVSAGSVKFRTFVLATGAGTGNVFSNVSLPLSLFVYNMTALATGT